MTAQGAYVDEGVHSMFGATAWALDITPLRYSYGYFLLYYYLGLFEAQSTTALFASRVAIALFSLLSVAVIYQLGRWLHGSRAGVLAVAIYCFLPFTFFHERMALADPFAAGFACVIAWRSLIFARHPRVRQGIILGILLALSTMAKLTLGLLPLLPVFASIIYFPEMPGTFRDRVRFWCRRYFPPLVAAAVIVIILWMPVLILAYRAYGTPEQFLLLDSIVIAGTSSLKTSPLAYIAATLQSTSEYTSILFNITFVVAVAYLLLQRRSAKLVLAAFFLIFWIAATTFLTFGFASILAPRYLIPAAAPVVLLIGIAIADVWARSVGFAWSRFVLRGSIVVVAVAWLVTFAVPFLRVGILQPDKMPLSGANYAFYLGGTFNSDETIVQASHVLDNRDPLIHVEPSARVFYGDQIVCRLVYFYMHNPITCLPIDYKPALQQMINSTLAPGEVAYLVRLDSGDSPTVLDGVCSAPVVRYVRTGALSVDIWRLQKQPCNPHDV